MDDSTLLTFHLCLSMVAGLLAGVCFLPTLRYANTYLDSMVKAPFSRKLLLNAGYFSPMFLVLCWVRPMSSDYIEAPASIDPDRLSVAFYDRVRLSFVFVACVCKLLSMRIHVQAYLAYVLPACAA